MYVPVSSLEKHKEKTNRTKVDKILSALATFAWVKHLADATANEKLSGVKIRASLPGTCMCILPG
jgi:hypothetical protein